MQRTEKHKTWLMWVFSILWALDTIATVLFVGKYGLQAEANPLMRALIGFGGSWVFGLCKGMVLCLWLSVGKRAHILIHIALVAIMVPVVYMGLCLAAY